ncbi:hypothetical protein GCM10009799_45260 [Nocardiopsis rhodophaea]|uniref:Uncharacterized protein n=1 Tax=Nocardiopsis rhodophaea TaxID=280238 RepID=A0ABN2TJQ8_9ACTN
MIMRTATFTARYRGGRCASKAAPPRTRSRPIALGAVAGRCEGPSAGEKPSLHSGVPGSPLRSHGTVRSVHRRVPQATITCLAEVGHANGEHASTGGAEITQFRDTHMSRSSR